MVLTTVNTKVLLNFNFCMNQKISLRQLEWARGRYGKSVSKDF